MKIESKIISYEQFKSAAQQFRDSHALPLQTEFKQPGTVINMAERVADKWPPLKELALEALQMGNLPAFEVLDKRATHLRKVATAPLDFRARGLIKDILGLDTL